MSEFYYLKQISSTKQKREKQQIERWNEYNLIILLLFSTIYFDDIAISLLFLSSFELRDHDFLFLLCNEIYCCSLKGESFMFQLPRFSVIKLK